jgi:succinate dehydrogenase hydrophobic anchor subunit
MSAPTLPAATPVLEHQRQEARTPDSAWTWQVASGALVLVLVAVHMVAQHLVVPGGLRDYEAVLAWLRSPIVVAVELLFLATVSWHGLLGLRAVLFDAGFSPATERRITRLLAIVWIVTVGYGLWLTSVIVGQT